MANNVLIFLDILALVNPGYASFISPNEISEREESFVRGKTEYLMLDYAVTWIEAQLYCESFSNGSLANIDNDDKRTFLGEALSETNLEMEDLWIGARKIKGIEGYAWVNNIGSYKPDKYFVRRGAESFINISRDCLAFSRQNHLVPHFINLECVLKRPFMCEKPFENIHNGSMTTPDWFVVGKFLYAIFYDRKTWRQSVRDCRKKHNANLAYFSNIKQVKIVGKFELIGRPSVENAWIGAYYRNGRWKFLYDGQTLPEIVNNKTHFPPWRQDRPLKRSGCLLLDRHLAKIPVFLEARCDRRRSYICSKEINYVPDYVVIIIGEMGYIMYYTKKSWDDAREQCLAFEAILVRVSLENIHDITYIMGENLTVVNHIWIGGRLNLNGTNFHWIDDGSVIPPNNADLNHYPPWYDNEYDLSFACLNMDRENHNRPMFYGAACDTPQSFICSQSDLSKLPIAANDSKIVRPPTEKTVQ